MVKKMYKYLDLALYTTKYTVPEIRRFAAVVSTTSDPWIPLEWIGLWSLNPLYRAIIT